MTLGARRVACALALCVALAARARADTIAPLCAPHLGPVETVLTAAERRAAGARAIPPLVDSFAWPDGPFGIVRNGARYTFFATDGGRHRNGKAGSVTMTSGDLDRPLRSGDGDGDDAPIDVTIEPDPDRNPNYRTYSYVGGGPVYLVPAGMPYAGRLLTVYHAERSTSGVGGFYSLLGLAASRDGGRSWHDLGEIVEANQPYRADLDGYEIGISQLVVDPTHTFFYVYFSDWIANGTVRPTTRTVMSVARVRIANLLAAAFGESPAALPPFVKRFEGAWREPGIGGRSSDLQPGSKRGAPSVSFDDALGRYVLIADNTRDISYAESPDGLVWTDRSVLFTQPSSLYARAVGTGDDPRILGPRYYVYYTHRVDWATATVERFAVSCP